jgi:hypothetical protein
MNRLRLIPLANAHYIIEQQHVVKYFCCAGTYVTAIRQVLTEAFPDIKIFSYQ